MPLAVVTGASTGIGFELARHCAGNGFDLLVTADEARIHDGHQEIGQSTKDDPADVAEVGFKAMMNGDGDVVSGWQNKLRAAIYTMTPAAIGAAQHVKEAAPGSGQKS